MKKRIFWGVFFGFLAMSLWQSWQVYRAIGNDREGICIKGKLMKYECQYCDSFDRQEECSWRVQKYRFSGSEVKCGIMEMLDRVMQPPLYKLEKIGEALAAGDCKKAAELWQSNPADYLNKFVNDEKYTSMPLLYYIIDNAEECLPEVYAEDIDFNAIKYHGETPFEYVLYHNREKALKTMLLQKDVLSEKDKDMAMVVDNAIRRDKTEMFKWLLDNGLSPTSENKDGSSLLMRTIGMNRAKMAALLIERGVKPDQITQEKSGKNTVTDTVAAGEKLDKYRLQRLAVAKIKQRYNDTPPLIYAIAFEKKDAAKLLIEQGADVNVCDHIGRTALQLAVLHGEYEIAALLIEHSADVNGRGNNRNGDTPLMSAPFAAIGMAELLIENGADVNAKNSYGYTPLMSATTFQSMFMPKGYIQLVELLLKHGAEVNVKDDYGNTPLKNAEKNGYDEIAELLRQYGAKE